MRVCVCVCVYRSVCLSVCLSVYVSVCLSVCLYVSLRASFVQRIDRLSCHRCDGGTACSAIFFITVSSYLRMCSAQIEFMNACVKLSGFSIWVCSGCDLNRTPLHCSRTRRSCVFSKLKKRSPTPSSFFMMRRPY